MTSRLSTAIFLLVSLIWGLLVFGASVRVHGAGLACPDWPLCFGEVIPQIDFGVFFEFGHRVYAGFVSLQFLAIGAALFFRGAPKKLRVLWGLGLVVLGIQVVLGGLTVLELLAQWTVTSHLLAGNTFCLVVFLLALATRAEEDGWPEFEEVTPAQRGWVVLIAVLLPLQLILGGLTSSSSAGLVCPSWPSCNGSSWFPTFHGLVGLQISHRLVGYGLATAVLGAFIRSLHHPQLRAPVSLLFALVLTQIAIGVGNVLMRLPVEITLSHTGTAGLIVLCTTWLCWRAFRAPLCRT